MWCSNLYTDVVRLDLSSERSHSILVHDLPGRVTVSGGRPTWYIRNCDDFVVIMLVYRTHEEDFFLRLSTQSCCPFPMAAFGTLVCLVSHLSTTSLQSHLTSSGTTILMLFLDISSYLPMKLDPPLGTPFRGGIPIPWWSTFSIIRMWSS